MIGERVDEIDVGVVELLAGYYSVNQPGRDIRLRLDAAQRLKAEDRHTRAVHGMYEICGRILK